MIEQSLRLISLALSAISSREIRARISRPTQRAYYMRIHIYNSVSAPGVKRPQKRTKRLYFEQYRFNLASDDRALTIAPWQKYACADE